MEIKNLDRPEPIKVIKCKSCSMKRECLNMGWFWPNDKEPISLYLCCACSRDYLGLNDED